MAKFDPQDPGQPSDPDNTGTPSGDFLRGQQEGGGAATRQFGDATPGADITANDYGFTQPSNTTEAAGTAAPQSPDAASRNESAPPELVSAIGDYLRKQYATGGQAAAEMGITDDTIDSAAQSIADRIHRGGAGAARERMIAGTSTPDEQAAILQSRQDATTAKAEFDKAKALNPNLSDEEITTGLADQHRREQENYQRIAGVLGAIGEFGPLKAVGTVAQNAADIGEGLFGIGAQKALELASGGRAGRGEAEKAVTGAVTSETDQMPAWLHPIATPILYAAGAGEAKRLEQERANLPSVDVGGVKLDLLSLAEMGMPLGGFGEGLLKSGKLVGGLAKVSRAEKGAMTAEQLMERIGAGAPASPTAGRVMTSTTPALSSRMAARAAALEAEGSPAAAGARQIANEIAARTPVERTNPAAAAQVADARENTMGRLAGAVGKFAAGEGGEGELGAVTGYNLAKAAIEKAKSIGKGISDEDAALLERVGQKMDSGESLTKDEQAIADRLQSLHPSAFATDAGTAGQAMAKGSGAAAKSGDVTTMTRAERGDQGAMRTSEGAQQMARQMTKALQSAFGTAEGGGMPDVLKDYAAGGAKFTGDAKAHGGVIGAATRAVLAGDQHVLDRLDPELSEQIIQNAAAAMLRKAGVTEDAVQIAIHGKSALQAAAEAAATTPGPEADALVKAAAKVGDAKGPLTLFGDRAPVGGQSAVAAKSVGAEAERMAASDAEQIAEKPKSGLPGMTAPVSDTASQQPLFGPERMPGDVQKPRQDMLKTGMSPHMTEPVLDAEGKVVKPAQPVKINGKPVMQTELGPEFGKDSGAKAPKEPSAFPETPIKAVFDEKTGEFKEGGAKDLAKQLTLWKGDNAVSQNLDKVAGWTKVLNEFAGATNLPRSIKAAFDLSAPLRQGIILSVAHPVSAGRAFGDMLGAFSDAAFARAVDAHIHSFDNIHEAMKLYIAPLDEAADTTQKEEAFMSKLLMGDLNVKGKDINFYRKSQYAYTTYLNKLRSDIAVNAYEAAQLSKRGGFTKDEMEAIGAFINHASGRGDLGVLKDFGPTLNAIFFSPRYTISRVQVVGDAGLGGAEFGKAAFNKITGGDAFINRGRQMAAADFAKWVGASTSMLMLAKVAHEAGIDGMEDVETDPRSTDFGKIRINGSRIDMWGGLQQMARTAVQVATNERVPTTGRHEGDVVNIGPTWLSGAFATGGRFGRSKLSPTAGFVSDIQAAQSELSQKNSIFAKAVRAADGAEMWDQPIGMSYAGEPYTLKDALMGFNQGLFTPMAWSDMHDALQAEFQSGKPNYLRGVMIGATSVFGAGVQTYDSADGSSDSGASGSSGGSGGSLLQNYYQRSRK